MSGASHAEHSVRRCTASAVQSAAVTSADHAERPVAAQHNARSGRSPPRRAHDFSALVRLDADVVTIWSARATTEPDFGRGRLRVAKSGGAPHCGAPRAPCPGLRRYEWPWPPASSPPARAFAGTLLPRRAARRGRGGRQSGLKFDLGCASGIASDGTTSRFGAPDGRRGVVSAEVTLGAGEGQELLLLRRRHVGRRRAGRARSGRLRDGGRGVTVAARMPV